MERTIPAPAPAEAAPAEQPAAPTALQDQPVPEAPREATPDEIRQIVQHATNELAQAIASEILGPGQGQVNPIPLAAQQRVEITRLNALIDTLVEAGVIDDKKLAGRLVQYMQHSTASLNKPKIAKAVNGAIPRNGFRPDKKRQQ